jgi:hypothetical protein
MNNDRDDLIKIGGDDNSRYRQQLIKEDDTYIGGLSTFHSKFHYSPARVRRLPVRRVLRRLGNS